MELPYGSNVPNVTSYVTSNEKAACWLRGISPTVQLPGWVRKACPCLRGPWERHRWDVLASQLLFRHLPRLEQAAEQLALQRRWRSSRQQPQRAPWWLEQLGCARSRSTQNAALLWPLLPAESARALPSGRSTSPLELLRLLQGEGVTLPSSLLNKADGKLIGKTTFSERGSISWPSGLPHEGSPGPSGLSSGRFDSLSPEVFFPNPSHQ